MIQPETFMTIIDGVDQAHVEAYVCKGWVTPSHRNGVPMFQDIDIARVRLIHELQQDMGVNDESVPIILALIDQVHDMRVLLRQIADQFDKSPGSTAQTARRRVSIPAAKDTPLSPILK